ncbi:hypothetical protein ACIRG5_04485 [Lentzea sp. NPDC102401]|uniref:hypothetical protein n=1 Tax=Lentzea sp. NPDC102401 TaxID=3364128 RepID=UPI00381A497B
MSPLEQDQPFCRGLAVCGLVRLAAAMNDRWFIDRVEEAFGWQAFVDCEAQISTVSAGARVRVAIAPPPGRLLLLGELVTDLDAPAREPVRGVRPHARDRRRPSPVHGDIEKSSRGIASWSTMPSTSPLWRESSSARLTPRRESMVREGRVVPRRWCGTALRRVRIRFPVTVTGVLGLRAE